MKYSEILKAKEEYERLEKVKAWLSVFEHKTMEEIYLKAGMEITQDDDGFRLLAKTIPDAIRATYEIVKKKLQELEV